MKPTTTIQPITMDLVRELRLTGHRAEARELLEAFREQGKIQKEQLKKEIINRDNQIKRFLDETNTQAGNSEEK